MRYLIQFNGQIEVEAINKKEAKKEAETGILYSLDDMMTEKKDFLKINVTKK